MRPGPNSAQSVSTPAKIAQAERVAEALTLRKAGASLEEIRVKCNYRTIPAVSLALKRAITKAVATPAQDLVDLEVLRLDQMHMVWWPRAINRAAPNEQATRMVLHIMKRRAELLGLDQPSKVQTETIGTIDFTASPEWAQVMRMVLDTVPDPADRQVLATRLAGLSSGGAEVYELDAEEG
jgi:hypothetical protein